MYYICLFTFKISLQYFIHLFKIKGGILLSKIKLKTIHIGKTAIENAFRFIFNLGFIMVFQMLFGVENVLPGVAISVGLTMFPDGYIGIKRETMGGVIVILYTGSVLAAQSTLISPWIAFIINFLFVYLIMNLVCEPNEFKPAISFLLCFIFSQATPVSMELFPKRLLGALVGGSLVAIITMIKWKSNDKGDEGRDLKEQILLCRKKRGYILRMSLGIASAMFIGMIFHIKKPLWISIVVMSLTQLHFHEIIEKIRHRMFGNIIGVLVFIILFKILIPEEYSFAVVLFLGYISFFTSEYKYKQIVNAVSAINASLVLLDVSEAIENRLFCLIGGALIVVLMFVLQKIFKKFIDNLNKLKIENKRDVPV